MSLDYLNIVLAFIEGFALIISPCILPILPIILSGSLEGERKRPYGIIVGFVVIFSLFTFFSRALVVYSGIDLNILREIAFVLLFIFGVIMLSTTLTEKFAGLTQRFANVGSSLPAINNSQGGFCGGMLLGALIGVIWTPCAGPILAAVIVQTVLQQTTLSSFLVVLFFGIGAGLPMLLIALFGRRIMQKFSFFKTHANALRKLLGVIVIASVLYLAFGQSVTLTYAKTSDDSVMQLQDGIAYPFVAPELAPNSVWLNSEPLVLSQLKGKVILIDFWTYSCINCLRTLPYLKDWYAKYHDKGLIIIGVHAPEFQFEHELENVKKAVKQLGIIYPVFLDNQFVTWQNFHNQFWPAHYLIDKNGNVVYQHFGEGEYEVTENNIRYLLGLNSLEANNQTENVYSGNQTPETYLGTARAQKFKSPEEKKIDVAVDYTFPTVLALNEWALAGKWILTPEKIISAQKAAILKIHFHAKKVFLVMGNSTGKPIAVKLLLNGEQLVVGKGVDVKEGLVQVSEHRLFELVNLQASSDGILQLIATEPGLEMYAFTFG